MINNFQIWYRRQDESKYHKIKEFVNRINNEPILSWNREITNKLFEFNLKLFNPIDEDNLPISIKPMDEIVITDFYGNVFGGSYIGIIEDIKTRYIGLDSSRLSANKYYDLKIRNKDFSTEELDFEFAVSTYINDLLPILFQNTPDLGGIKRNGIVIPKHDYGSGNFLIPPLKIIGSQYEILLKILDTIGWGFTFYYFSEEDPINNLHILKQLSFFPKNVGKSAPSDWQDGITFDTWLNALTLNRDYPNNDDSVYIYGEKEIISSEKNSNSKNSIKIKVNTKDVSNINGKRARLFANSDIDTYELKTGVFDIKSVGIKITDNILTVTSTTVFTISEKKANAINYYQERMNNNGLGGVMRCRIISGSTEYFRDFTLNISTFTITLTEAIISLNISDFVELIGCYDVLKSSLTSYPPDVNGYVVKTLNNENATIKFTKYDKPETGSEIIIYYYPITEGYKTKIDTDLIRKGGFRGLSDVIKEPITDEQSEELFNEYKKIMKPLQEFELLISHRKNILELNTLINVDFEDKKGSFLVIESSGQILSENGLYRNTPLIIQNIKLASYKNNLEDILAKIRGNSIALTNQNLQNNVEEINNNIFGFREISENSLPNLITPIMLDPTNILIDRFTMNFISSNITSYRVLVSSDMDFVDKIVYNLGLVSDPETLTSADIAIGSLNYPVWVKIQAIRGTELSSFSNVKQVNFIDTTNLKIFLNLKNNSLIDNSSFGNDLVLDNGAVFTSGPVLSGDTTSVYLDGTNDYAYVNHDSSFDSVDFTFEFAFKLHSLSSFMVLVSRFDNPLNNSNAQFYSVIIDDKLTIYMYDSSYNQNTNYTEIESTSINGFAIDTEYIVQFSYNNTTKSANLVLNRNNVPFSENVAPNAGIISLASLNLKSTAITRILLGAYEDSSGLSAGGSYLRIGRFRYWTKSHTLSELQDLYDNLITT